MAIEGASVSVVGIALHSIVLLGVSVVQAYAFKKTITWLFYFCFLPWGLAIAGICLAADGNGVVITAVIMSLMILMIIIVTVITRDMEGGFYE